MFRVVVFFPAVALAPEAILPGVALHNISGMGHKKLGCEVGRSSKLDPDTQRDLKIRSPRTICEII